MNAYTVLSIDPGMHNLGYAFSKITDKGFFVIEHGTKQPSKYTGILRKHNKHFTDRTLTGKVISSFIEDAIFHLNPDYICSEDAFYNPIRPTAYTSLLIAIYAIESKLYHLYSDGVIAEDTVNSAKLYKIPPTLVKKVMSETVGGKANKFDMYDALKAQTEKGMISFMSERIKHCPKLDNFTEHSVDAICIGYAFTKIWKPIIDNNILDKKCTGFTKAIRNHLKKIKYKSPYL